MYAQRMSRHLRALPAAALAACTLFAQDSGFYKDVKIRLGYGLQSKDNLQDSTLGFGLDLGWATPGGRWGLELGYFSKAGDSYLAGPHGTLPADLTAMDTARFGDSRRNSLDGFSARFSFQKAIDETWSWQAGLMVGGTRFKHEYVGQAQSQGWAAGSADPGSWLDTWNGTPTKGGFKVSPFAGITWNLGAVSSLEFNVLLLDYTALEYVHEAGSGTYALSTVPGTDPNAGRISPNNAFPGDTLVTHNRLVPHLEVGYVFHF